MADDGKIKKVVRERYGELALRGLSCCQSASCCPVEIGEKIGYTETDLQAAPEGANLGLGCGNPLALASLSPGETVLDLGSGAGFDCFLAARRVGATGRVIGVDMTPEMIERARRNAETGGFQNVEFRLGDIENLPVAEGSVDVVISNCVINLSTDKDAVLREAFRVLRPGGRFAVADIVALREIPAELRSVVALWTGCISGSLLDRDYVAKLTAAGFVDASVEVTRSYDRDDLEALGDQLDPTGLPDGLGFAEAVSSLEGAFASAFVRAVKPA